MYSVIVPIYNQVQNLPITMYLLYQTMIQHTIQLQVIIVEDNSPDGSRQVAMKLAQFYTGKMYINVIGRNHKLGIGSAYRQALKYCQGQFVIIMDADLSHHPKYIPIMITKQKQSQMDIVTSTRYVSGAGVQGWNFFRKLISRTANYITTLIIPLQPNLTDLTGSYRLYNKKILEMLIAQCKCKGYAFQMQVLVLANLHKLKIKEIPIVFVDRMYGKSKLGIGQIWSYLKGLMRLFMLF